MTFLKEGKHEEKNHVLISLPDAAYRADACFSFRSREHGDFTVTGGTYGVDYTYDNGVLTITGGDITVRNTDPSTPTGDRIMVSGQTTLTIAGLNIQSTTGAPVEIDDTSATAVTLILENENTLI